MEDDDRGAPAPRFLPKVPPRRKRAVKEEDHELMQMLQVKDDSPLSSHPTAGMPGGTAAGSGLQPASLGGPGRGGPGSGGQGPRGPGGGGGPGSSAANKQLGASAPVTFRLPGAKEYGQQGFNQIPANDPQRQVVDESKWLREPEAPVVLPFTRSVPTRTPKQRRMGFPAGSAADLLLGGSGDDLSRNILFFQLPPDLPTSASLGRVTAQPREEQQLHAREFPNRCKELGSGSLGKMQLHRSGRVTFRLGEITYEVSAGTECMAAQELVALSAEKCCSLGDVRARMLCVPSIQSLTGPRAGRAGPAPAAHGAGPSGVQQSRKT